MRCSGPKHIWGKNSNKLFFQNTIRLHKERLYSQDGKITVGRIRKQQPGP